MKKLHGTFASSSGLCDVHYYFYIPESPKAAVILSHGMCEYITRYTAFAQYLCDNDIALCGCDHLGHGSSVADDDMLGYFGEKDGHLHLVHDLHRMKLIAEKRLPDIPHFLVAHSMGSFTARIYLSKYTDRLSGAILMGTAGPVPWLDAIHAYLVAAAKHNGGKWRYDWGMDFAMGVFNLRNQNHRTRFDWLSRDDRSIDRFIADPKCNFIFTAAGCRDLIALLIMCNTKQVIASTRTDVPLLFLSGGMDPVGEYGAGVRRAAALYRRHGCDATLRIYREARHELLFELNKDEVRSDILSFLINRI
ncbi:MAG: alpha/beta hydrolase [Ruminococcaceae bacterium]|nr:alpha/beta hydrolase [Oscillospiraceae bacterium]